MSVKTSSFKYTKFFLYAAFISPCLEDRAWSFCISVSMGALGGMQVVSFEQLFKSFLQMLVSGSLGKFLDRLSRKEAIITVALFNNLSLCLVAVFLFACLSLNSSSAIFLICLISSIIFYGIHRLFLNAEKSIVSRDWVVVLSKSSKLSNSNATLAAIDQFMSVLTPIFVGFIVTCFGLKATVTIFGLFSLLSLASKSFFLYHIYKSNESLWYKKAKKSIKVVLQDEEKEQEKANKNALRVYYDQYTFPAALGMAMFCKTVMGFDGLAVGYAASVGLPFNLIGILRSYGSIAGMLGVFSYAFVEKRFSLATSGMLGLVIQQIFASLAVISIWLPGSPMDLFGYFGSFSLEKWLIDTENAFNGGFKNSSSSTTTPESTNPSIIVFLIAIATAKFGLCCINLATTHIMQINTAERERNTVFGVQHSLRQFFSVPKELLVMIFPQNATFALYILSSYGFVTLGQGFFIYYLMKSKELKKIGQRRIKIEGSEH